MEIFGNWCEAEVIAEQWRKFYKTERPHSSLGYQTPEEFKRDWEKQHRLLKIETMRKLAMPMAQGLGSVYHLGQGFCKYVQAFDLRILHNLSLKFDKFISVNGLSKKAAPNDRQSQGLGS